MSAMPRAAPALEGSPPGTQWRPRGYHALSRIMGSSNKLAIFRRFNDLNMISLLSLQGKLINLRQEFRDICVEDDTLVPGNHGSIGPAETTVDDEAASEVSYIESLGEGRSGNNSHNSRPQHFAKSFHCLMASKSDKNNFQYTKLVEIRKTLAEYNSLLLQVSQLSNLQPPEKNDLEVLRTWLGRLHDGISNRPEADEIYTWEEKDRNGETTQHDLITIAPPHKPPGRVARWIVAPFIDCYHRRRNPESRLGLQIDEENNIVEYHDDNVQRRIGTIISAIASSVIPAIAVLGLYFEKDLLKRISIMISMTAVFALILAVFSTARNIEVFAATTAFAAVEVVFIGSTSVYFGSKDS